jgi:hypothetical protein
MQWDTYQIAIYSTKIIFIWHELNSKKSAVTAAKIVYWWVPTMFYSRATFDVNIKKKSKI